MILKLLIISCLLTHIISEDFKPSEDPENDETITEEDTIEDDEEDRDILEEKDREDCYPKRNGGGGFPGIPPPPGGGVFPPPGGELPPPPSGGGGFEVGFGNQRGRYRQTGRTANQKSQNQKSRRMSENMIMKTIPPACNKFYEAYKEQYRSK